MAQQPAKSNEQTSTSPTNSTISSAFELLHYDPPPGVEVTEAQLKAARAKLDAQYAEPTATVLASRPISPGDGCPQCGGAGMLQSNPSAKWDDPDFGKPTRCPDPCHNDDRLRQLALISNMNEGELSVTLNDLKERHDPLDFVKLHYIKDEKGQVKKLPRSNRLMLQAARRIIDAPYGFGIVYILGPNGNGKTTCGQAICNGINLAGKGPAMYLNLVELISFVRASYDPNNAGPAFDQRYDMISKTPCVIVDEFDFSDSKNADTQHTLSLVQRWLNDRYRLAKIKKGLTVLIGNEPVQGLGLSGMDSRLKEGWFTRLVNTGEDERPEAKE